MPNYKTVETRKSYIEVETERAGRDGWRVNKLIDHHSDDTKILIEFVQDD